MKGLRFVVLAVVAGMIPVLSRGAELDTLRLGTGTLTSTVARLNGFFQKYGIEVQKITATASETMRGYLADGSVDVVDGGLDNAVAEVLSGVDVVIVTGSSLTDQELIAQPGFKSAKELRGKPIIVDAVNTQNALILKKILLVNGLKQNVDYELKSVGNRRLTELENHKEYAAGMLSGTTAILAKREGFVSLGTSAQLIGPILFQGTYVRRQWAREHADLLARYIAANIEAQRWILNPINKDKIIQIIMTSSDPQVPLDIATEAYAGIVSGPGALTKDLTFNAPAFETFLKLRAEVEGSWGGTPPPADTFYDLSYYRAALTKLK